MALNKGRSVPTRPPRPKVAIPEDRLIYVHHRDSMRSKYAANYHLVTDLPTAEVERRLRGNWSQRIRSWWHLREYKKWAVLSTRIHREMIDSNNLTHHTLSRKNGELL